MAVVGAGPAGALVADELTRAGLAVLLVDAGPRPVPGVRVREVDRRRWPFVVAGAEEGNSFDWYRVRAVGGRSHLWGGWCHRLPQDSMRRAGWPERACHLDRAYERIERRLGVREGLLDPRYAKLARRLEVCFVLKRAAVSAGGKAWTPLGLRVARHAREHAIAVRLEHDSGHASILQTFDMRREKVCIVRARAFVLAASPVETARILLSSALHGPGARGIGRNLVDHMVATYVLIEPLPPPRDEDRGPFPGAALVENFVNRDESTRRPYPGGFSIELTGPFDLETFDLERMASPDERRSLRATQISALGECFPHPGRYVDLDPSRTDAAGQPLARLHVPWSTGEQALADDLRQACTQIADAMAPPGSRLIKFHDPLTPGAGHEAGTCRMGGRSSPSTSEGRVRALKNVWVADASALPTAGDRHPTLTVLAQALRAAGSVRQYLARSG